MGLTSLQRTPAVPVLVRTPAVAPTSRPSHTTQALRPLSRDAIAAGPKLASGPLPAVARTTVPLPPGPRGSLELAARGALRISQGNQVSLFVDGRTAFPALVDLIRGAKSTLYIETMIWHNDDTGRRIAEEVVAARKRGVDVKVLVDSVGQHFGAGRNNDPKLLAWMRAQGVDVHTFNPRFLSANGVAITHHKLYIADNERFLSGGMNIGNEYEHDWHDMLFQVQGPATREAVSEFAINWAKTTGKRLAVSPAAAAAPAINPSPGTAAVGIAVTDPDGRRFELRQTTLNLIGSAKHSIRVQMPYNSDDALMEALKAAARRGVNVEYIMPAYSNDSILFDKLNLAEAQALAKAGVKVRLYGAGTEAGRAEQRFSHLKMMLIDDVVASVGSANADFRSFRNNNELNAYIADPEFTRTIRQDIWDKDWQGAKPVTAEELRRRPPVNRMAGAFFEVFDRFM